MPSSAPTSSSGFVATTRDGKPLRMALVDEEGNIIEAGDPVAGQPGGSAPRR
ncbi:hypothetical protein ACPA9J_11080 [Pseudomonas aeruginosa]